MKLIFFLLLIIFNNLIFCQDNSWNPKLSNITNIGIEVYLCTDNKDYEYLQYEVYRDVVLYLKNAGIIVNENKSKDNNFLLSINMLCSEPQLNSVAISINFSLGEKVYIKRTKSYEYASIYQRVAISIISKGVKDFDFVKSSIIDITKNFILDYKLDNP